MIGGYQPGDPWTDPRAPDGVTILAPYEQARPTEPPGLLTGDEARPMQLFDLAADPGEQRDVAAANPAEMQRLMDLYQQVSKDVPPAPAGKKRKG